MTTEVKRLIKSDNFKLGISTKPLTKAEKQEIKENWDVFFEDKMAYENNKPTGKTTYVYFDYPKLMWEDAFDEVNEYLAMF